MWIFLLYVFFMLLVLFIAKNAAERIKQRQAEIANKLERYASTNNFEFKGDDKYDVLALELPVIFEEGHDRRIYNLIKKEIEDGSILWGDHNFIVGHGKGEQRFNCSFIIIENKRLDIPNFFIRDESPIWDSLGKLFGGQDINFNNDGDFSSSFVLQGQSEDLIRKFFTRKLRDKFAGLLSRSGYKISGFKNHFVIQCVKQFDDIDDRIKLEKIALSINNTMTNDNV